MIQPPKLHTRCRSRWSPLLPVPPLERRSLVGRKPDLGPRTLTAEARRAAPLLAELMDLLESRPKVVLLPGSRGSPLFRHPTQVRLPITRLMLSRAYPTENSYGKP